MTMNGALHPKSDIDRLYLGRKNGGRGLISCEYCVRAEENNLRYYLGHTNEPLLNKVRDISGANVEETMEKREFKRDFDGLCGALRAEGLTSTISDSGEDIDTDLGALEKDLSYSCL